MKNATHFSTLVCAVFFIFLNQERAFPFLCVRFACDVDILAIHMCSMIRLSMVVFVSVVFLFCLALTQEQGCE